MGKQKRKKKRLLKKQGKKYIKKYLTLLDNLNIIFNINLMMVLFLLVMEICEWHQEIITAIFFSIMILSAFFQKSVLGQIVSLVASLFIIIYYNIYTQSGELSEIIQSIDIEKISYTSIWLAVITLFTFSLNYMNTHVCGIPMKDIIFWTIRIKDINIYIAGFVLLFPGLAFAQIYEFKGLFIWLIFDLFLTLVFLFAFVIISSREKWVLFVIKSITDKKIREFKNIDRKAEIKVKKFPITRLMSDLDYNNYEYVTVVRKILKKSVFKKFLKRYNKVENKKWKSILRLKDIMALKIILIEFIKNQEDVNILELFFFLIEEIDNYENKKIIYIVMVCALIDAGKINYIDAVIQHFDELYREETILISTLYLEFLEDSMIFKNISINSNSILNDLFFFETTGEEKLETCIRYWYVWNDNSCPVDRVFRFWKDLKEIKNPEMIPESSILQQIKYNCI